jgi:uncharacterized beta-barrel protein YwiB (DUF1934 family)
MKSELQQKAGTMELKIEAKNVVNHRRQDSGVAALNQDLMAAAQQAAQRRQSNNQMMQQPESK